MLKQKTKCRDIVRELYLLSESGAFDDMDMDTIEPVIELLIGFLNPTISYDEASKIFDKPKQTIRTEVSRKLIPSKKRTYSSIYFKYQDLKKIIHKNNT